jgi:hypothetical protein
VDLMREQEWPSFRVRQLSRRVFISSEPTTVITGNTGIQKKRSHPI